MTFGAGCDHVEMSKPGLPFMLLLTKGLLALVLKLFARQQIPQEAPRRTSTPAVNDALFFYVTR